MRFQFGDLQAWRRRDENRHPVWGVASLTVSNLTAGERSITASYVGSSTEAATKSSAIFQVVNSQ